MHGGPRMGSVFVPRPRASPAGWPLGEWDGALAHSAKTSAYSPRKGVQRERPLAGVWGAAPPSGIIGRGRRGR